MSLDTSSQQRRDELAGGVPRHRALDEVPALVCIRRSIVRLFEITGLDRAFPLHPTLADALAPVPLHAAS